LAEVDVYRREELYHSEDSGRYVRRHVCSIWQLCKENSLKFKVYYRGFFKKDLHMIAVDDAVSPADAIEAVTEDLNYTGELYIAPVLALIQGGKTN
jgi:hypothetical protein